MASTEQELNIAKDLLEKQEAINKAKNKQKEIDADILGFSSSLVDSIKEVQGISTKRSTFDSNILKINKDINKEILGQKSGLSDISSIQKQMCNRYLGSFVMGKRSGRGTFFYANGAKYIGEWKEL